MKIITMLLSSIIALPAIAIADGSPTPTATTTPTSTTMPAQLETSITPGSPGASWLEIKLPFEITNHMLIVSAVEPTTRLASTHDVEEGTRKQSLHLWAAGLSQWKTLVTGPAGETVHVHTE